VVLRNGFQYQRLAGHSPTSRCLTSQPCEVESAIDHGAVGQYERLYFQVHEHSITEVAVIGDCCHLLRHVPGKLLVLWDGAPIHRSRTVKQFLHEEAGERLHLEHFPGYAPEIDPQEGIWRHFKHV
jgi:hypothetical protein